MFFIYHCAIEDLATNFKKRKVQSQAHCWALPKTSSPKIVPESEGLLAHTNWYLAELLA